MAWIFGNDWSRAERQLHRVYWPFSKISQVSFTKMTFFEFHDWNFLCSKNVPKKSIKFFKFKFSNFSKNGFGTIRDEQIDQYGPGIIESIDRTWAEVKPLYQKLHAVARFKIDQIFGKKLVKPDGAIPAHLLVRFHNSYSHPDLSS